jgi:hypothetical protein
MALALALALALVLALALALALALTALWRLSSGSLPALQRLSNGSLYLRVRLEGMQHGAALVDRHGPEQLHGAHALAASDWREVSEWCEQLHGAHNAFCRGCALRHSTHLLSRHSTRSSMLVYCEESR